MGKNPYTVKFVESESMVSEIPANRISLILSLTFLSTTLRRIATSSFSSLFIGTGNMLIRSLPMKSRQRWAHDVTYISATNADLAADVTYIDCQTQNGSADSHVFATFKIRIPAN